MAVFGAYSKYYNLLYKDKDYAGEVEYLAGLLKRFSNGQAQRVMELGCGSGNHAFLFAERKIAVIGVDVSEEMVAEARERLAQNSSLPVAPEFHVGDVRDVRLKQKFDVVFSLFHVVSYQNTNKDLLAQFRTAREHLDAGGLFIFDVWYGPAVLSQPPEVRIKRLAHQEIEVTRLAEPIIHPDKNLVDVNYEVQVRDLASRAVESIRETHHMRYLFSPELEFFLKQAGFSEVVHSEEWLTGHKPGFDTWGVVFVARA